MKINKKFIKIPPGSFMMGSDQYEDEQPIHKIDIQYSFYISKYQVTNKEYLKFANETKNDYPEWCEKDNKYNIKTGLDDYYKSQKNIVDDAAVIGISWNNAKAYCEWLSKKEKKVYRLPSEVEWEYACRANTITKWSFGDDRNELKEYAWYDKNSYDLTINHNDYGIHSVGEKKANPFGLYDMHGNVWEWCEDWYASYKYTPKDGKANDYGKKEYKSIRGGSWYSTCDYTTSSNRSGRNIYNRFDYIGFRLVLEE